MFECAHFLEFHRPGDLHSGRNAGRFLVQALEAGGVAVAIAGARNAKGILRELERAGQNPIGAMQRGRFDLFESSQMLSQFVSRHGVNRGQFDRAVASVLQEAKQRAAGAPLHVFGDMVGVLWQREKRDAAVELEKLWIALQQEIGFALFCAYPVDVFSPEFSATALGGVLETHTHLSPSLSSVELGRAFDIAMDEVLGDEAAAIRALSAEAAYRSWPSMPKLEKMILWLRANVPEKAGMVLSRARDHYERRSPRIYLRQEHFSR